MKLIHFSEKKITQIHTTRSVKDGLRGMKPNGFWVSDESDYGWQEWCSGENFATDRFNYQTEVVLKPDAKILYIKTAKGIDSFTEKYKLLEEDTATYFSHQRGWNSVYDIDWQKLSKKYQGIIITPYQGSRRLASKSVWYYGWDCASGCIWDAEAIASFTCSKMKVTVQPKK